MLLSGGSDRERYKNVSVVSTLLSTKGTKDIKMITIHHKMKLYD